MNNHRNGAVADLAKRGLPVPADPRMLRIKVVAVDLLFVTNVLLQLDGTFPFRMEGWPKDAQVISCNIVMAQRPDGQKIPQFHFIVHHPDFPVVLAQPEIIAMRWARPDLEQAAAEDSNERGDNDTARDGDTAAEGGADLP